MFEHKNDRLIGGDLSDDIDMKVGMSIAMFFVIFMFCGALVGVAQDDQKPADSKPAAAEQAKPADVTALQQQVKELQGQLGQLAAQNQKAPAEQLKAMQDALTATLKAAYAQASVGCKALGAKEMTLAMSGSQPSFSCVVKVK